MFATLGDPERGAVSVRGARLWLPCPGEGGDEGCVAAHRTPTQRCSVHDEVEPSAVFGRHAQRRSASCMACGASVSAGSLGTAASQAPPCGPPCERRSALEAGCREGNNTGSQ